MSEILYADRAEAGSALACALANYASLKDTLLLALPRGGVPVAAIVADTLALPMDIMVVRKLGIPGQPELAMGAIASGGAVFLNRELTERLGIPATSIDKVMQEEYRELKRREHAYRGDRPYPDLNGKTAIMVDDGLATGASMKASIEAVRKLGSARIVVAIPVGPPDTVAEIGRLADEIVVPMQPDNFYAVGQWYRWFDQTSDETVQHLLAKHWGTL